MAGPFRNIIFGLWTQEELERLFGDEMPDIDLIAGYVGEQPESAPTEAGSSRYALEDFTESQPVEGEEYVPSTQLPETAPRDERYRLDDHRFRPVVGLYRPVVGKGQVQQVQCRPPVIQRQREVTKGH